MGIIRFIFGVHIFFCLLEILYLFLPNIKNFYFLRRIHLYLQKWILPIRKKMRQMNPQASAYLDFAPIVLILILFLLCHVAFIWKIYIFILLMEGLSHFFPKFSDHPYLIILKKMTTPVLTQIRKRITPVNGVDLSYVIAILISQLLYWIW